MTSLKFGAQFQNGEIYFQTAKTKAEGPSSAYLTPQRTTFPTGPKDGNSVCPASGNNDTEHSWANSVTANFGYFQTSPLPADSCGRGCHGDSRHFWFTGCGDAIQSRVGASGIYKTRCRHFSICIIIYPAIIYYPQMHLICFINCRT